MIVPIVALVSGIVLVVLITVYVGGPVLIRFLFSQPSHVEFKTVEPHQLSAELKELFRRIGQSLAGDEFSPAACLTLVHPLSPGESAACVQQVYVNRSAGDMAMATVVYQQVNEQFVPTPGGSFLQFTADFPDGVDIETTNSSVASVFPRKRLEEYCWVLKFPEITDPAKLYNVHRAAVRHVAPGRKGSLPEPGEEAKYLSAMMNKEKAILAEVGCMYLDERCGVYRPTWRGALMMTWKQLWPVNRIMRVRLNKENERLLDKLGIMYPL
jgi:hypothetical protein